ncbi:TetR/AcrR family transcriptional regulator C-terminal domain-containing protein [Streptomyces macrosporus]|uniref:TetR/AcrR family transcriptional regulator C-terminal domain-containing protein n=1 Tax=Streptomyces macrosporus TaxID=44032 RepID=A0ABP5XVU8_9ACTN
MIWTRPERTGRGPRPAHTRAEIARAAVRIADADGIEAVSMRRVAAEIGCGTMSLYNYVPRKEDLYELMVDAAAEEHDLSALPTGDWRADMLTVARDTRDLMRRHPWLTRLLSAAYGFTPNTLRHLERCMAALEGLDATGGAKLELLSMINGSVMAFVSNEVAAAERARAVPWTPEEEQAVRNAYLTAELGSGRYPHLAAAVAENPAPTGPHDYEAAFERAVGRLLDAFDHGGSTA